MLSEIVKVVDGGGGGGVRFKMLSSGKFFGLSEKIFGLPEKYCPWPPLKHWSHGATADRNVRSGKARTKADRKRSD